MHQFSFEYVQFGMASPNRHISERYPVEFQFNSIQNTLLVHKGQFKISAFMSQQSRVCNSWQCIFLQTMKMLRPHARFLVLCCNKGMLMVWLCLGTQFTLVGVREITCFCLNTAEHCPNSWTPVRTTY